MVISLPIICCVGLVYWSYNLTYSKHHIRPSSCHNKANYVNNKQYDRN